MSAINIGNLDLLFKEVQLKSVFSDNKTFVDCSPKRELALIYADYLSQKTNQTFDLKAFVLENFNLPHDFSTGYVADTNNPPQKHINALWEVLTRSDKNLKYQSTLIELPFPYIVPGGRFGEIYYWDSYFTMLGLQVSGKWNLIENMLDNFSFLINELGYIPNGNRTYFLGRSQPPFFALMVNLLAEEKGEQILLKYLPFLEKEYAFWMKGTEQLVSEIAHLRVVKMPDNEVLNRFWDENDTPRAESYKEDIELAEHAENAPELWRNIRAACESGWDFSTRWFKDVNSFASIHTTDLIPVDLNCILFFLEKTLHKSYLIKASIAEKELSKADIFAEKMLNRRQNIQKYCWNEEEGFFFDYNFKENKIRENFTLAGVFPLFFGIASTNQAEKVAQIIEEKFLCSGGLITTLEFSSQQWDAPNGWAPLQWIAFKGLKNYGFDDLANKIKENWLNLNEKVFKTTGKFTEKYDVFNEKTMASGGEYPNQDGFGWTNGVYLKMLND